jgi:hypothetical protein
MREAKEVHRLLNRLGDAIAELADEDSRKSRSFRISAVALRFGDLVLYLNEKVAK